MSNDVTMKTTKKEMLEFINKLQKELEEKEKNKLNPEKVKEETRKVTTVKNADETLESSLSVDIHTLKLSINRELTSLSDKIEAEAI